MKIYKLINEILYSKTIIESNKKDNEIIILIIKKVKLIFRNIISLILKFKL
jgi:hypothetical protein